MVGIRNCGRLGNFLYMAAAMIGYARKHGLEYSVPNFTNNPVWNPIYLQHLVNPKWVQGREDILINENWNREQHYQEIPFEESWREQQIVLNGYWQSWKYWDRDEVIETFWYPYEFWDEVCSVHVRRGDYLLHPRLHPICTKEYYLAAVSEMIYKYGIETFIIHSDDIAWCKNYFENEGDYAGLNIFYSENKTPEEDLISMANCEHQICSNSTMALWGAELNQNPNKVVIVPHTKNWFGVDNQAKMTVKDLYRPEWVQIEYEQLIKV